MVGRINFLQGFLFPSSVPKRLVVAWLILPLSLAVLVPPVLLGLGLGSALEVGASKGLGLTLATLLTCLVVGSAPFTLLAGYLLRCRQWVLQGQGQLPPWQGLKSLFHEGGKMDLLGLLLLTPSLALVGLALLSLGGSLHNLHQHPTWGSFFLALVGSGGGLFLLALALLCYLWVLLISPMATLRLALGESPWQSLQIRPLLADIAPGWLDYLLCCLLVWGLSLAFQLAQAAFWPLILISFPAQVYLQLVWSNLLGQYGRNYLGHRLGK